MESIQTNLGGAYSQIRNIGKCVDRVDHFGGATFVTNEGSDGRNGISLGNFINTNITSEISIPFDKHILSDPLYMHEYGHSFDCRRFGPAYLLGIGIPSAFSAGFSSGDKHNYRWYELRANSFAKKYFGKHYNVDWNEYIGKYPLIK